MERRSNLMVLLGIAFFLVGGLIVFLVLQDDDDGGSSDTGPTTVVVATQALDAGTFGDDILAGDLVETREVPIGSQPVGALNNPQQLAGQTLSASVPAGDVITSAALTNDRVRTVEVPEGFEAVAIQMDLLAGGGGYVDPGDRINVYGTYATCEATAVVDGEEEDVPCPYSTPRAELLLTNVEVLDVDIQLAPNRGTGGSNEGTATDGPVSRVAGGDQIVFLLAVATVDAEKVIYQTEFERMYVTITAEGAGPAGPTPGRDFTSILSEEPNQAFSNAN